MNDCLVTKLKSVVQNDNLARLGYMIVECNFGSDFPNARPTIVHDGPGEVRIIGDAVFADTGTKVHALVENAEWGMYDGVHYRCALDYTLLPYGQYKLEIPKYKLANIGFPIDRGGMTSVNHRSVMKFDVADFAFNSKLDFNYAYQDVYGDISKMANMSSERVVDSINISDNPNVYGTMKDLFLMGKNLIDGTGTFRAGDSIVIMADGITSISGSASEAINAVKDTAKANFVIYWKSYQNNIVMDVEGLVSDGSTYVITFDGNGGYTIAPQV